MGFNTFPCNPYPISTEELNKGIYDSEKDIYATMGEMGAKNLIPYPYYEASGKDNRGVVFTYGNDGIVYMNGTSEQSLQPFLSLQSHLSLNPANILEGHSYILYCDSDSPYVFSVIYFKNGSNIQVNLAFSYEYSDGETGTTTQNYISLLKDGVIRKWVKFTVTSGNASTSQIDIRVDQGSHQVNNAYGKVMLIDGRDTDLTWKIFAKTNKQLTDDVASLESGLTKQYTITAAENVNFIHKSISVNNKNVNMSLIATLNCTAGVWTDIGTISRRPNDNTITACVRSGDGTYLGMVEIIPTGRIHMFPVQTISSGNDGVSFSIAYCTND